MKSCLVIGAGMSGLTAARKLTAAGLDVIVLDKGRGVGGRMATRRIDDGVFDHGAQFITVRSPEFSAMMDEFVQADVAYEWCRGIGTLDAPIPNDSFPRYQPTGGMTAVPKFLATGLDVRLGHRVSQLSQVEKKWRAEMETGQTFGARSVVCTAPVPQALDILDLGGHELPEAARADLDRIKYARCLAVMAILDGPSGLPAPGALREIDDSISFVCDNQMKGISPDACAVTIHATREFSRGHWSIDEKIVVDWLLSCAAPLLKSKVRSASLHRWRYAQPLEPHPQPCLLVGGKTPIVFAGDAFNGPRVEGAALSGLAAADALLGIM
jgi:predicted NAD/FAD-dependent oxidoreductase